VIYVDDLVTYDHDLIRSRRLLSARWCHLLADTREELHAFAGALGLKRWWFQQPDGPDGVRWHYDITASKRRQAVSLGAKEVTFREVVTLIEEWRALRCIESLRSRMAGTNHHNH
jgi:hypothetical protein